MRFYDTKKVSFLQAGADFSSFYVGGVLQVCPRAGIAPAFFIFLALRAAWKGAINGDANRMGTPRAEGVRCAVIAAAGKGSIIPGTEAPAK